MKKEKLILSKFKKIICIALIVIMLIFPFINLLNVKAIEVTITTDDNKKVTNTTNIIVDNIMGNDKEFDEFTAYKILDTYYDKDSNNISYKFTNLFENYKKSSYAKATWYDYTNDTTVTTDFSILTIDEYLSFTSAYDQKFQVLINSFSKYIKSDKTNAGIDLVSSNNQATTPAPGVEVGSYLILPSRLVQHNTDSAFGLPDILLNAYSIYDALIANATFSSSNNSWVLEDCSVTSKGYSNEATYEGYIMKIPVTSLADKLYSENEEDMNEFINNLILNRELQKDTDYSFIALPGYNNNVRNGELWSVSIKIPEGLDYDTTNFFVDGGDAGQCTVSDNKIYLEDGTEYGVITDDKENKTLTVTLTSNSPFNDAMIFGIGIKLNDKAKIGSDGNIIESTYKFGPNAYDPTDQKILTFSNIAKTYGIKTINMVNDKNSTIYLSNSVFGVYTDAECTNELGRMTSDENGIAEFKFITTGTYYIKQLKSATGYKINPNIFTANVSSTGLDSNGYLSLEIANDKSGLLPSTGGLGTIIYTMIGLLTIVIASVTFIKYRQNQVEEIEIL